VTEEEEFEVAVKSFVSLLGYCFTRFGLVVTSLATSFCFCVFRLWSLVEFQVWLSFLELPAPRLAIFKSV
jgi:hypothetical protein